jgi:hypothetical protein
MNRRTLATVVLSLGLLGNAFAFRVLEQVENAYELSLAQVELPADAGGALSFKVCDTCRTSVHQVTRATQYFLNGTAVTLDGLSSAAADIRKTPNGEDRTLVAVYVDIESQRVTRVAMHQANR